MGLKECPGAANALEKLTYVNEGVEKTQATPRFVLRVCSVSDSHFRNRERRCGVSHRIETGNAQFLRFERVFTRIQWQNVAIWRKAYSLHRIFACTAPRLRLAQVRFAFAGFRG